MSMTWLANVEKSTAWVHHTWNDFAALPDKARYVAILPVHGFADHGMGLPLDAEETISSEILRRAVVASIPTIGLRVLPPLRFALAPLKSTLFGVDPETAHDLIHEIATSVHAAGFKKLVFLSTSPWNEELIDAASRDTRVSLGLQTFVVNLSGLGLNFHPAANDRPKLQAIGSYLLGKPSGPVTRPADVSDVTFRPGNWKHAGPVAVDASLDGEALLAAAGSHLARLISEIDAKAPLGRATLDPAPVAATRAPLAPGGSISPGHSAARLWPDYRERYLPSLTGEELEAWPNKESTLVILPTGAIEQHGYHLPVGVDSILGQAWLNTALPKLAAGTRVLVAPAITYGKSNEHVGFPGTVFISAKSLRRLLLAQAAQLHALGFRTIGILNTHGGNSAVIVYTLREIQATLGMRAGMITGGYTPPLSDVEREFGFHAGEWETALMMAATEGIVQTHRSVCEYPARPEDPGELRPENAPAIFSWISSDISRSGTMGDATAATIEKGERWIEEGATALAKRITALAT